LKIKTLALVTVLSSYTAFASPKLVLKPGLKTKIAESDKVKARVFGLNLALDGQYKLSDSTKAKASAGLALETGSNKSAIVGEFVPKQHVFLNEAFIDWTPLSFLNFQIGANNQRVYNSPLFLDEIPFFGLIESLQFEGELLKVRVFSQQAIPSNNTLELRTGSVEDGTPQFIANSLDVGLKGNLLAANIQLTQFQFKNLTHSVAYNSQFFGNTILGNLASNSEFAYEFSGYNIDTNVTFSPGEVFKLKLDVNYLYNDKAPDNSNTAYLFRATSYINDINFSLSIFEVQKDASIAFYNSGFFGHNNRQGFTLAYGSSIFNKNTNMKISFSSSSVITPNIYQADSKKLFVELNSSFDLIK